MDKVMACWFELKNYADFEAGRRYKFPIHKFIIVIQATESTYMTMI